MSSERKIVLPGSDFVEPPEPQNQSIALLFGFPGSGKTSTALRGAPGPLAFFDVDQRGRHALKYVKNVMKKHVLYASIDYPMKLTKLDDAQAKAAGQKSWDKFAKNFDIAIEQAVKGNVRTIIIDTATELGEILKIAVQGRIDRKNDDYGKSKGIVNTSMAKTIKMVRNTPANLILLARAKEVWEDNKPTGKSRHEGLDCLAYDADWAAHVRLKKLTSIRKRGTEEAKKFELEITKAGIDIETLGNVYGEDDWGDMGPFVYACTMNYPGTSPEDWE